MIILASGSPRRHELLRKLCTNFLVEVSDAAEAQSAENPATLAVENATRKAQSVAAKHPDAVVIASCLTGKFSANPTARAVQSKC